MVAIRVERFDLARGFKLDARVAKRLVTGTDARVLSIADQAVYARVVPAGHVGLLYVDGETLEKVTEKVGTLSVYGGLDAVLNELVRLKQ